MSHERLVTAWLVRLWDTGMKGINLTAVEAEELSVITTHLPWRERLHKVRQYERNPSLTDLFIRALRNTWWSPAEVYINARGWRTREEEQVLWSKLGTEAIIWAPLHKADRAMFTKLKKTLIQQRPQGWYRAFVTFLSPLKGQDLYKMVEAFFRSWWLKRASKVSVKGETKRRKEKGKPEKESGFLTWRQMCLFWFGSRVPMKKTES